MSDLFCYYLQSIDELVSFSQFTFASNAATIIGGCLITTKYKLRLPAAFISAFVISVSALGGILSRTPPDHMRVR